jgi:hypothetical protein
LLLLSTTLSDGDDDGVVALLIVVEVVDVFVAIGIITAAVVILSPNPSAHHRFAAAELHGNLPRVLHRFASSLYPLPPSPTHTPLTILLNPPQTTSPFPPAIIV